MTRGRADVSNIPVLGVTEKTIYSVYGPSATGLELMFKVCKLGNHEGSASISAHAHMLFEANARCLICCNWFSGAGGGGILSILFSDRINLSNLNRMLSRGASAFTEDESFITA
jgi:hypothetical protein